MATMFQGDLRGYPPAAFEGRQVCAAQSNQPEAYPADPSILGSQMDRDCHPPNADPGTNGYEALASGAGHDALAMSQLTKACLHLATLPSCQLYGLQL